MRILPKPGDSAQSKFLIWARLFVGLAVCVLGVLTQFSVTINQSVEKPKVVRVVSASNPTPVEKNGELTEGECYAIAKDPGDWDRRKLLDTFGVPKTYGYDDDTFIYPLKGDDDKTCDIATSDRKDGEITSVSIDLYEQGYGLF
jgi:hypothetical protein